MPLNKPQLKQSIRTILDESWEMTESSQDAREHFANGLSNAIDTFVRGGEVNTTVTTNAPATGAGIGSIT